MRKHIIDRESSSDVHGRRDSIRDLLRAVALRPIDPKIRSLQYLRHKIIKRVTAVAACCVKIYATDRTAGVLISLGLRRNATSEKDVTAPVRPMHRTRNWAYQRDI